ncbi:MAG: nitroreductase [Crocinitomicaceae bacterium]|nr:nitroreductase [Crocinitomicaceae bacterium]
MKYNLSEITELIKNRRTIYPEQFSARKVQKEQIENLLNNAIWAPTHGNTQPWRFTVFMEDSRQTLADFLGQLYIDKTPKEEQKDLKLAKMLNRPLQASAVIAVAMHRDETEKIREIEEVEAVACAIHNMQLTATAYGLGSYWSTSKLIYTEEMKTFLNLTTKDLCLGLIYIGYPAIEWPKQHRKPIEYVTTWK